MVDGRFMFLLRVNVGANVMPRRTATGQKVGTSLSDDGLLASDHRPVFTDFEL